MPREARDLSTHVEELGLVRRMQAGDVEAFEKLFRQHNVRIYHQAMHLIGNEAEAEEIMQEVFLTLYDKAETFRGDSALSTWLYRLTANVAISRLRRRSRSQEVPYDDYLPQFINDGHHQTQPVIDWSHSLDRDLERAEASQLLQQAIESLRPLDKAVVVLSDLEELSNRETADILGLSVSAVKARLHRARLFLRGKLTASLGNALT